MGSDNSNADVLNAFLSKIYKTITKPLKEDEAPSNAFISFTKVGFPLTKQFLDFGELNIVKQIDNNYQFPALVNSIPKSVGFYESTDAKISSIMQQALQGVNIAISELTKEQSNALERCRNILVHKVEN